MDQICVKCVMLCWVRSNNNRRDKPERTKTVTKRCWSFKLKQISLYPLFSHQHSPGVIIGSWKLQNLMFYFNVLFFFLFLLWIDWGGSKSQNKRVEQFGMGCNGTGTGTSIPARFLVSISLNKKIIWENKIKFERTNWLVKLFPRA